ncbi:MAG: ribosome maturation factor RimP [Thermoleophilaceae bacterium]|nr:ribosome maturation factor RimP [Thermoleophilaceae bacterium]
MATDIPTRAQIQERLGPVLPEVEVLLVEPIAAERLRLVIDHPHGVSLDMCERVTKQLGDLLEHYGMEVSSPGPERPLVEPDHFRRFLGRKARVRTREPYAGHKSFTGELLDASDEAVTLAAETGVVSIPYAEINRSNLLEG